MKHVMKSASYMLRAIELVVVYFMLVVSFAPCNAFAGDATGLIAQGECGECTWTLSESGALVIAAKEGTRGQLPDLSNNVNNGYGRAPWDAYRSKITSARFEGSVVASRGFRTNDIGGIFGGSRNLVDVNLSGLSLGEVTGLDGAFYGCDSLEHVDLSPLDVSRVDSAYELFQGCKMLKSFVLGQDWAADGSLFGSDDYSYWMYESDGIAYSQRDIPCHPNSSFNRVLPGFECGQWYSQGSCKWCMDDDGVLHIAPIVGGVGLLGSWNHVSDGGSHSERSVPAWCLAPMRSRIKKVRFGGSVQASTCDSMFSGLIHLAEVDWAGFDMSSSTSISNMFAGCCELEHLSFPRARMEGPISADKLFSGCESLKTVDMSGLSGSRLSEISGMFSGCSNLARIDLSALDLDDCHSMDSSFSGCASLQDVDLSHSLFPSVDTCSGLFYGCTSLASVSFAPGSFRNVTEFRSMFEGCSALVSPGIEHIDFSSGNDLGQLFYECASLTSIDLTPLSSCYPNQIDSMFDGCSMLRTINLAPIQPLHISSLSRLFAGCTSLTHVDLSRFDGVELLSMNGLFNGCANLVDVRMPNIEYAGDSKRKIELNGLFAGCESLTKISFDWLHIPDGSSASFGGLLSGCSRLKYADVSALADDYAAGGHERGVFEGCDALREVVVGPRIRMSMSEGWRKWSVLPEGHWEDVASGAVYEANDVPSYQSGRYRRVFIVEMRDVDASTPHHEHIEWLVKNGISTGWDNGDSTYNFRPYAIVVRADMAAFLYRLAGEPSFDEASAPRFSDVTSSTPHRKAIMWLASRGISKGWDNGDGTFSFRPYANVARADMAALLYRLAGSPEFDESSVTAFRDVDASTPHREEILWLASSGVSKGWDDGGGAYSFRPYLEVARCDMAAFLHRMDENGLVDKG